MHQTQSCCHQQEKVLIEVVGNTDDCQGAFSALKIQLNSELLKQDDNWINPIADQPLNGFLNHPHLNKPQYDGAINNL